MEIAFQEERAFSLRETLSWEEAKERAWDNKTAVFGSGIGKLFTRPKPDDVKIIERAMRKSEFKCELYFAGDGARRDEHGNFYVASEMKALIGVCRTVDDFPPGHYLDSELGEIRRYY